METPDTFLQGTRVRGFGVIANRKNWFWVQCNVSVTPTTLNGFLRTITDDLALLEMEHQNRFAKNKNEIDFNNCVRKIYSLNYFGVKRFLNEFLST